ncbi:hypothetical protein ACCW94_00590 [Enterobacter soli]|uniref:hypothetical protein n=1 Tax=Enterobacter soli TaxID=885040 RepID=UPI003EDA849C
MNDKRVQESRESGNEMAREGCISLTQTGFNNGYLRFLAFIRRLRARVLSYASNQMRHNDKKGAGDVIF